MSAAGGKSDGAPDLLDERRSLTSMVHDFEPVVTTPHRDGPTSVYQYFDERGALLYVGITSRGIKRNREHNTSKIWWDYVSTQTVEHYPTRDTAAVRERELIKQQKPPFNAQHNPDHARLQRIYFEVRRLWEPEDAGQLFKRLGRELPLTVRSYRNAMGQMSLETHPAHQDLAMRVTAYEATPGVILDCGPNRGGVIVGLAYEATQMVVTISGRRWIDTAWAASARLQMTRNAGAKSEFSIRHVLVTTQVPRVMGSHR